jgi:Ser/Thr protein kinase RdoA (MazF antagonist)
VLVAALSHFLELKSKLELPGFERYVDLTDDQANALWPMVRAASDSLASLVPSLIARDPTDDALE